MQATCAPEVACQVVILFVAALVLVWSPLDGAVQSDPRRPDVVSLFSRDAWARAVVDATDSSGIGRERAAGARV